MSISPEAYFYDFVIKKLTPLSDRQFTNKLYVDSISISLDINLFFMQTPVQQNFRYFYFSRMNVLISTKKLVA